MGLFGDKEDKDKPKKLVVGVNPELVGRVKDKVSDLKRDKDELRKNYHELFNRMSVIEAKTDAIETTFNNFRNELMSDFMEEARKALKGEVKGLRESLSKNHSRMIKLEDEIMKFSKRISDLDFMSSFNDYYQLIKLCIYLMTNAESSDQGFISLLLQTIHSLVDDMRMNGYWESGRDAVITSLLNLKTYWRSRDERVESLISAEIDALESLR